MSEVNLLCIVVEVVVKGVLHYDRSILAIQEEVRMLYVFIHDVLSV